MQQSNVIPLKPVPSSSYPSHIRCVNPATGEHIGDVPTTHPDEIPEIFAKAREAQKEWVKKSFEERREHMNRIRDYMIDHTDDIARVISQSTGKTISDALVAEVMSSIVSCDWYAKSAKKFLDKKRLPISNIMFANKQTYLARMPYGLVGILSPWNYPFGIPFAEIIMALMAGNAVVYKPAEETAMVGMEIEKVLKAGGLPLNLTRFMVGDPAKLSQSWFDHKIDKIFFTGSVRVGKVLMKQASVNLTPLALELGGNDAMIVLEDANLERAANGAVWGGFQNTGQACASVERIYVLDEVHDAFVEKVVRKTEKLRIGPCREKNDVDMGSLTVGRQKLTVERHVRDAIQKGAEIAAVSQMAVNHDENNNFYPATVLINCDHSMAVMQEETFGPVIAIMRVKDEEEALKLANDSDLGLTSSIWTMNTKRGLQLAERVETGVTTLNDHLVTYAMAEVPWIGWKNSGVGATHSHLGLEEMTRPKAISYDLIPQLATNLWWYPQRPMKYHMFVEVLTLMFGHSIKDRGESIKRLIPKIINDPYLYEKVQSIYFELKNEKKKGMRALRQFNPKNLKSNMEELVGKGVKFFDH